MTVELVVVRFRYWFGHVINASQTAIWLRMTWTQSESWVGWTLCSQIHSCVLQIFVANIDQPLASVNVVCLWISIDRSSYWRRAEQLIVYWGFPWQPTQLGWSLPMGMRGIMWIQWTGSKSSLTKPIPRYLMSNRQ